MAALLLAALVAAAFFPLTAQATPPLTGGGTFQRVSTVLTGVRVADDSGNIILTQTITIGLTGTITGTSVCEEMVVLLSAGNGTFSDACTFTGTVNGASGGSIRRFQGTFSLPADSVEGQVVIFNGTGDLAGLHGTGTFTGSAATGSGTYSVEFHFDP